MSTRLSFLLLTTATALAAILPAPAQSCQDHLRLSAGGQTAMTVSVRELLIPAKAWEHFERACLAANDPSHATVFERETAQALTVEPGFAEIFLLRAQRLAKVGRFDAVIEAVAAARRIRPYAAWSSVLLAGSLSSLHHFREASAELDRAGGLESDTWQWKFEKARAEVGRHDIEEALRWSARALAAVPPGYADAHIVRANALLMAQRQADAVLEFEAYLASAGDLTHRDQVQHSLEGLRAVLREDNARLVAAK